MTHGPLVFIALGRAGPESLAGCACYWYLGGRGFDPPLWQHSFIEISHKIFSMAILSLSLIQVGQLTVTVERMCTKFRLTV